MPSEPRTSREHELVRWHPGPCPGCARGVALFDYLRERHQTAGEVPGDSEHEIIDELIAQERGWLTEWIAICPHRDFESHLLMPYDEGSEHLVFIAEHAPDSVIKVTRIGIYGDSYSLVTEFFSGAQPRGTT